MAFDEVASIRFEDKAGIQIMKDYMAAVSFFVERKTFISIVATRMRCIRRLE